MKILKKIGTIIIGIILSIKAFAIKVYAMSINDPLTACDYGIVQPVSRNYIYLKILSIIAVPIILLIGLIIYFIKSKNKIWKKIIIAITIIILYIIFRNVVSNI